jgi:hypothetical protein
MAGKPSPVKTKSQTKPSRYSNVGFRFLGAKEDTTLYGTVLVRDREMVLDIPEGGDSAYLIVGTAHEHWFEGRNSGQEMLNDVNAKWAAIGNNFVGIWIETGHEYLFSFELGSSAGSPP